MNRLRAAQRLLAPGVIVLLAVILSGMIAGFTTLRTSRETVEQYVSVWEEEVARNLLLKGDAELFEKIRAQILDLASDVQATGTDAVAAAQAGRCFAEQNLSVTLYGTPAGALKLCRSPEKLLLRSLASPVFAFGLMIGALLMAWQIRRANRDEAARALSELAVRVAHDIRAPLMALKIVVAGDKESTSNDEARSLIHAATNRISAIADDLLARSRVHERDSDSGRSQASASVSTATSTSAPISTATTENLPPHFRSESASRPGKTVHQAIQEIVREKIVTTANAATFDVPEPRVLSELGQTQASHDFERVISNLLQNAIEASLAKTSKNDASAKPRIIVDTVEAEHEVAITIRDNGIGIPRDVLSRIGEVGFSYGKNGGNGVGFSSAKRWVENQGGELTIRSLEGTGTEVRLTLPRRRNLVDPR